MKLEQISDRRWVFSYEGTLLSKILFGLAFLFLTYGVIIFFTGDLNREKTEGLIGAILSLSLFSWLAWERSSAVIDLFEKNIRWRRKHLFRSEKGNIPFHEITHVMATLTPGEEGEPYRRLEVICGGTLIPLTRNLKADDSGELAEMAEEIGNLVGCAGDRSLERDLQSLVDTGRELAAIKLLRLEKGGSLYDAKEEIRRLKGEPS